jgi:alpha-tubulin suppressor-like RCC1 family protein
VGLEVICYGFQSGPSAVTVAAASALGFTQLSAGGRCGLTGSQLVYCWTATFDSPTSKLSGPIAEGDSLTFVAAAIGQSHMCGILAKDRSVVCWGANDFGQLGDGMLLNSAHPVPVARPFP